MRATPTAMSPVTCAAPTAVDPDAVTVSSTTASNAMMATTTTKTGCPSTCRQARCGDGLSRWGSSSAMTATPTAPTRTATCQERRAAGDGVLRAGVESATTATKTRAMTARSFAVAPSAAIFRQRGVEQCDDGNRSNGDDCLNDCNRAPLRRWLCEQALRGL